MKVSIVYDTKYGNTKLAAEKIAEGMRETDKVDTITLSDVKRMRPESVVNYDAIVMGGPVHFGAPSRTITKFIDKLGKLGLGDKRAAVFDTYLKTDFEKGVKPLETRIMEKVPGLKLVTPGLSVEVKRMEGPIAEGELPKCVEFGRRLAGQINA